MGLLVAAAACGAGDPSGQRARIDGPAKGTAGDPVVGPGGAGSGGSNGGPGGGTDPGAALNCLETTLSDPGAPYSRRLTRTEYDRTVRDLLGDSSAPAQAFPQEEVSHGYDNDPSVLTVPPLLAEGYLNAAETLAASATKNLSKLVPCAAVAGRTCGQDFIKSFGEKAFRRPLTDAEVTRYLANFDVGAKTDFASGIRLVVTAMLQSAPFLYRIETMRPATAGEAFARPDAWEMASRLSYLFWQSMPDDALMQAARADALKTPEQVATQARRLLNDPRARDTVVDFFDQWLALRKIDHIEKDPALFPGFSAALAADMRTETKQLITDVVFGASSDISNLFASAYTFVNDKLAAFYGLPPTGMGAAFTKVTLDPAQRAGILTSGGVMSLLAKYDQTSPVLRGKFVREHLLCQELPPPPVGLIIRLPELSPTLTTRERFGQHSRDAACAGCHVMMDPIGLGFENFDAVGRFRSIENGQPVDASGNVAGTDVAGDFVGPAALGAKLGNSTDVKHCITTNAFRYANGRGDTAADACALAELDTKFAAANHDFKELMIALTQTDAFLFRRGAP